MEQISKADTLALMQSDMKMWETAETEELGGGKVKKTINLPFGIGEVSVTLEGMTDGIKRRGAVSSYGEYIRGIIDECINDEAITARAQQDVAAARGAADRLHDEDAASAGGGSPVPNAPPVPAHGEVFIPTAETIVVRIDDLERELRDCEARSRTLRRELNALNAFKEVLDGQEADQAEPTTSDATS